MKIKSQEKLEALLQQQKDIQARIEALQARTKDADRKARTRRLIIIGGAVEAWADQDPTFAEKLNSELSVRVKRDSERRVLGLVEKAQQVSDPAV